MESFSIRPAAAILLVCAVVYLDIGNAQASFNPLTAHLLEMSTGIPGANVSCKLYRKSNGSHWDLVGFQYTSSTGRIGNIVSVEDFVEGEYKFWSDSEELYNRTNTATFYPFVEVRFVVTNLTEHCHIPILMSPFGYSTYKGSFSAPSAKPPPPLADPILGFLLDSTSGTPAANVPGSLYRLQNLTWQLIIKKNTSSAGVINNLFKDSCDFTPGTYKLRFKPKAYWRSKGFQTVYPYIDITFKAGAIYDQRMLIATIMSPYLFTTSLGSTSPNPVPCLKP